MRYAVAFAAVATAFLFQSSPSHAYSTAPWCSYVNTGYNNVVESCVYRTFEACRDDVLGGNRGFCNVNPYYEAREPARRPSRRVYQGR